MQNHSVQNPWPLGSRGRGREASARTTQPTSRRRLRVRAIVAAVGTVAIVVPALHAGGPASAAERHPAGTLDRLGKLREAGAMLYGVSARTSSDVWAVGGSSSTLAQHWDGSTWTVTSTPTPAGAISGQFQGVTAISANDVWAAGTYTDDALVAHPLVAHWNGKRWARVLTPNPGRGAGAWFTSISAASVDDVWAVGTYWTIDPRHPWITWADPLVEHWDGTRWSRVTVPNPGHHSTGGTQLTGVSADTDSGVWIVGSYDNLEEIVTLALHWDGSAWTQTASRNPAPRPLSNMLASVTVISDTDVWAVGNFHDGTRVRTLTEHWNGRRWSTVASPSPGEGTPFDGLRGVSGLSPDDVWAIGAYASSSGLETLIEHWDGSAWSQVTSCNPTDVNGFLGVDARSAADAWAVGIDANGSLVCHWDGRSWS
jgi:hypothetical protein